jgi:hypothetical protein
VALAVALVHASSTFVRADGGAVRVSERAGVYLVNVLTLPTPVRVGPLDVSVLVQDAATGEYVAEARVTVSLTARGSGCVLERPATTEAATNKLFRAAEFQLPEPGWWDVAVAVHGPHGAEVVRFALGADEPLPRWLDLWPWYGWPFLVIALFGAHRIIIRSSRR